MIERQRILLAFIDRAPKLPTRTQIMKWLFLLGQEHPEATRSSFYEFLPYRYGPFSFQAYRELHALESSELLVKDELRIFAKSRQKASDEMARLPRRTTEAVDAVLRQYANIPQNDLLADVYDRYPWYASRSELRPRQTSKSAPLAVYTVGYEGRTIDGLLDHLLWSGIHRVLDVRKNAMSRKYGFAGKTLARLCGDVGVDYVHIPELGIPSSLRTDLSSDAAYRKLFEHYERAILSTAGVSISRAADLCGDKPTALMCFEAASCHCHRGRLAPHVAEEAKLEVQHL